MRKILLLLGVVLSYSISFSSSSESIIANARVSIIHSPELVVTDEDGVFSLPVALSGLVTDTNSTLPTPIPEVVITLPYYSEDLTGTTNDDGEYITQTLTMSGTVVDSDDQPIANAWVSIRPQLLLDTADESGTLRTGGGVGTRAPFSIRQKNRGGAILKGNRLLVASSNNLPIVLSLFSVKGQKLFSSSIEKPSEGARNIRLPELPAGFYLFKVACGSSTTICKQVFFSTRNLIVQRHEVFDERPVTSAQTAEALFADTLVAFADGYHVGYAAVPAEMTTDIKITLETSDQWKPAGPEELEHESNMVKIKAAGHSFSIGQPVMLTEDIQYISWGDEVPAHPVSFSYDFWMDTTEVTQKQFTDIMTAVYENFGNPEWKTTYGLGDDIPAYSISFGDAMMYCNARSKADSLDTVYSYTSVVGDPGQHCELNGLRCNYLKNGYRLPTEAEWEYACRGGTVTDFYWNKNLRPYPATADDTAEISEYAIWGVTSGKTSTDPDYAVKKGAALKKPNNYGLYDMAGSLLEYTIPAELYYSYEAEEDPIPSAAATEIYPVLRGGNWGNNFAANLRSSCRKHKIEGNYDYWFLGFRTVKEVVE